MSDAAIIDALADLGEQVARHADEVRDHGLDEDDDRVTVVELWSGVDAPAVHYIPHDVWESRVAARGEAVHDDDAGVWVVSELRLDLERPIIWGVWPALADTAGDDR